MTVRCCICHRVPDRHQNLFDGNKAPGIPKPEASTESQQRYCLCDGSKICDRRAVSDTTAQSYEPQRRMRLGVPQKVKKHGRRRRSYGRQPPVPSSTRRTYQTRYKYEI